jgi:hypothetical protein
MSPRSKREYIESVFLRYKHASREKKKRMLDEFCDTLGYHRKHAIRVLRTFKHFSQPKAKKRGRSPTYQKEEILKAVEAHLARCQSALLKTIEGDRTPLAARLQRGLRTPFPGRR